MNNRPPHHWTRVLPPVLLCSLLWGSAFPCIKLVYQEWKQAGVEAQLTDLWWFAGVRFTIAGSALLLISKQPLKDLKASPPRLLAVFALTQTAGQYLFFYFALSIATGSLSSLVVSTGSFWWLLLAPLLLKTPWPTRWQWVAILVGAAGVTIATYSPGSQEPGSLLGVLCMLAATLMGALGIITFSKLKPTIGPRAGTGFSLFAGGLILLLVGAPAFAHGDTLFSPKITILTLWLAFVSAAAFTLWNHLSTLHPVNLLASYRFLIPVCGIVESLLFIPGEKATPGLFIGGILVVGSLIAAQKLAQETKKGAA
jgi:drug/metabolite transporter (DMT)-like permease